MSDFWKKANSTEFSIEQRVCYDTTSFDGSVVFEYEESYIMAPMSRPVTKN